MRKGLLQTQIVWIGIFIGIIVVLIVLGYFLFGFAGEEKEVAQTALSEFSEGIWGAIRGIGG